MSIIVCGSETHSQAWKDTPYDRVWLVLMLERDSQMLGLSNNRMLITRCKSNIVLGHPLDLIPVTQIR